MPYDTRVLLSSLNLQSINLTVNHNKDVLHKQNEHKENRKRVHTETTYDPITSKDFLMFTGI